MSVMSTDGEGAVSTLYNMMQLVDGMRYDHDYALQYMQDPKIVNRNSAVIWMKNVSYMLLKYLIRSRDKFYQTFCFCVCSQYLEELRGTDCPSIRDTSIQILDKFLLLSYAEDRQILSSKGFLLYAAAASIILGSKLNDAKSPLTMVSDNLNRYNE